MNFKSNNLPTLILFSRVVLSLVLYYVALYYCVGVGDFVGKRLSFSFYNVAINSGLTGVKWVWPSLFYAVLTFIIGMTIAIILLWRVFLKDYKRAPFTQITLANFMRHLLSFSVIGFWGGVTLFSVDRIVSLINVIARL